MQAAISNSGSISKKYLQNSSAEKCSFHMLPGDAFVNEIQYVTFKPVLVEQSDNTMNHHVVIT
ncbi:hypothetical protein V1478_014000 [Vespula squamosa]|uniref:Uncharacterized protein n=1 Tax=Vespula squamosa TaxID=30214 RepID=A0ABD2A6R8_VESSQ